MDKATPLSTKQWLKEVETLMERSRRTERILLRMTDDESEDLLNPRVFDSAISVREQVDMWIRELKANTERAREEAIRLKREEEEESKR